MLTKLAEHLKNVLLIKFVMYGIIIGIFISIIPWMQNSLENEINKKHLAEEFLENGKNKLNRIQELEKQIISGKTDDLNKIRQEFTKCEDRLDFVNSLSNLNEKYELYIPIEINSKLLQHRNKELNISDNLKISHFEITINFVSGDLNKSYHIMNEVLKTMPQGSVILSSNVNMTKELTPKIIAGLSPQKTPELINNNMKILLREVHHE